MKVLILSDPSSPHTIKWANSLNRRGIEIYLFGLSQYDPTQYDDNIKIKTLNTPASIKAKLNGNLLKVYYLIAFPQLKKVIRDFNPHILHSHYAASYGLLGAMSGFYPFILSVWGIDILSFPKNSFIHKRLVQYSLKKADKVLATSEYLAKMTNIYTRKEIQITPFGVDTSKFRAVDMTSSNENIIIGTVKSMEGKYGIEYLIKAFSVLSKKYPDINIKLLLIGGGSLENKFNDLISDLGISEISEITGSIGYNIIEEYHNRLSIAVYYSDVESFGVSVLESLACEKAVVVSNVGGLPEIVIDDKTGIIVESQNVELLVAAIEKLLLDEVLRKRLGKAGRQSVIEKFNWDKCVDKMIEIYRQTIQGKKVST